MGNTGEGAGLGRQGNSFEITTVQEKLRRAGGKRHTSQSGRLGTRGTERARGDSRLAQLFLGYTERNQRGRGAMMKLAKRPRGQQTKSL